jgi:hypothetical protein
MRFAFLFAVLLAAGPVTVEAAPPEKENLYEIELLVFEQRLPQYLGDEMFAGNETGPSAAAIERAVAVTAPATAPGSLAAIAAQLERDPSYRVLAHPRWTQPSEPKANAKARRIQGNGRGGELDGTVKFYSTRFLHLDANLVLHADGRSYRLRELRRVRVQDLHYFDHPRLGILARVTPLDRGRAPR